MTEKGEKDVPEVPQDSSAAMPAEDWDLESVYDTQIAPLMQQIIAICKEHRLPVLASFEYRRHGEEESFVTTCLTFPGRTNPLIDAAYELLRDGFTSFALKRGAGLSVRQTD